jgi:tRNA/tmRNA/rRNA uracil-C5-methylase (TrmA/RlmC/RlmD family)
VSTSDAPVELEVGDEVEVEVGPAAHGGHCVARYEGRVLFVRHALPGEQVRVRVTSGSAAQRFWRADVVEVLEASPDRVEPPCPWARPGLCGGCDWQHASLPAQRELKAAIVREQLDRLGGVEVDLEVEAVPVPGREDDGLGWRTRVQYAVDASARAGLRQHRSHRVVPIDWCRIATDGVRGLDVPAQPWPGTEAVEAVAAGSGERAVAMVPLGRRAPRVAGLPDGTSVVLARPGDKKPERVRGRTWLAEPVVLPAGEETFRVAVTGFWQVHPAAAATLAGAVHELAGARPGETALDLYSGVGLFTSVLAAAVGEQGSVLSVESDGQAVRDAKRNLHEHPQVRIERGRTETVLDHLRVSGQVERADVVVLDPPRSGAGRAVVDQLAGLQPRVVVYVACDPAALGRDTGLLAERGYRLDAVRAFDLFPMTQHVECVARFVPGGQGT